ncbi:hypothetical protein V511_13130 [Mesotoga sp. Brook.08.YT.4.2.5.1]|nr:hypothetical protein V511_13130 [Mesotoga sp. Brook.08.YT.4.2.5.1]PVD17042.1 hypothetical protein V512_008935 [Mesotoga sp. Brook.08.105.5.1]RAO95420.1 hypothetical protein M388_06835 [Mesotoga sp. Brook.08.YT.4.2.5.4.]RDI93410.1 hypothetical protein Q502_05825 [Mesotoga sp. Brook.08.YT.4.2.5.2.]
MGRAGEEQFFVPTLRVQVLGTNQVWGMGSRVWQELKEREEERGREGERTRKTVQTSGARLSLFSLTAVSVQREAAVCGHIHLRTCQSLFFAIHNQL